MKTIARNIVYVATAALLTGAACSASFAQTLNIDPNTLPPRERQYALYGNLGNRGPTGAPADPGCTWSRLQVPTAQGLRWIDQENCSSDNKG